MSTTPSTIVFLKEDTELHILPADLSDEKSITYKLPSRDENELDARSSFNSKEFKYLGQKKCNSVNQSERLILSRVAKTFSDLFCSQDVSCKRTTETNKEKIFCREPTIIKHLLISLQIQPVIGVSSVISVDNQESDKVNDSSGTVNSESIAVLTKQLMMLPYQGFHV